MDANLKIKDNLTKKHVSFHSTTSKIVDSVLLQIPDHHKLKLQLGLIEIVSHGVINLMTKEEMAIIDFRDVVIAIMNRLFDDLTDNDISLIHDHIQYMLDRNLLKRTTILKKVYKYIKKWFLSFF